MSIDPEGLDARKAALEVEKLELERKLLDQKLAGKEPYTFWQKTQLVLTFIASFGALMSVLIGYATYRAADEERKRLDFQAALDQYKNGWAPGVLKLGALGEPGLQALVYSIDPTGDRSDAKWPHLTLPALDELARRRGMLTPQQIEHVRRTQEENQFEITRVLVALADLTPDATKEEVQKLDDRLTRLTCVQHKLQSVSLSASLEWGKLSQQIRMQLRVNPDC